MLKRRPIITLAAALLGGAGLIWLAGRSQSDVQPIREMTPGTAYAVQFTAEGATFDLKFQADTRYWLVVGSLGDPGRTSVVTLQAESSPLSRFPGGEGLVVRDSVTSVRPLPPLRRTGIGDALKRFTAGLVRAWSPAVRCATASVEQHGWLFHLVTACPTDAMPPRDALANFGRTSNGTNPTTRQRTTRPPDRDFFLHVTDGPLDDPQQYVRVAARVIAEGRHVRVYLDRQQSPDELAPGVADEIVRLFEQDILPVSRARLGGYRDVDGDGTFTILLTPWLNRLQGGATSLGGFVRGSDFRRDIPAPLSNQCDMLYLNTNVQPGPHLHALLAHEFTHAVCFSERLSAQAGGLQGRVPDEEDWLNEAIAHVAENVHDSGWSNLDYRISRFLNDPQRYPLVVSDYYRSGLWRDHGCRGAAYLFLRWCVDRFGDDLLTRLIHSPLRGQDNLERAAGVPFDELFRRWTLALLQSGCIGPKAGVSAQHVSRHAPDEYRSLDLRGRLAGWGLAGPRVRQWDVDGGQRTVPLRGTAATFWELHATGSPGGRRIHIRSDSEAPLQVSIVKRRAGWPRARIETEFVTLERTSRSDLENTEQPATIAAMRLRVLGQAEGNLHVETVSCEHHHGELRESCCCYGEKLRRRKISDAAPAAGCDETYLFPVRFADAAGDVVIKVVCSDAHGRRATAWQTFDAAAAREHRLEMALMSDGVPSRP